MIILLLLIVALAAVLIFVYNGFVSKRNQAEEAFSSIDVILKKRFDLIPNLVETVKGYASHERETLESVVNLRSQGLNATSSDEKMQLDKNLSQAVNKILVLSENYPDLKANENFIALQSELSEIETEIERSKRYYNGSVRDYNTAIESFPGNLMASSYGFHKKEFLELANVVERETPKVQF